MLYRRILSPNTGTSRWLVAAAVAALAGVTLYRFLLWSPVALASHGMIIDDAWFYSVLARHLLHFGKLTFDGNMTTNGVQPLWCAVQAGLRGLFPTVAGTVLLARASWLFYVVFAALTAWYVCRPPISAGLFGTTTIAALTLLNPLFQTTVVKGLETPAMLLVLMLTLITFDRAAERSAQQIVGPSVTTIIALALLTALLFFARTDLFWAPILVLGWLVRDGRGKGWRTGLLFVGCVAALVLPYLSFNILDQGALMPISGRVKLYYLNAFYPTLTSYLHSDEWTGPYNLFDKVFGLRYVLRLPAAAIYLLAAIALLTAWGFVWVTRRSNLLPPSLRLLAIIVFLHLLYMQLGYRELRPYTAYYFAPELLFVVLAVAFFVTGLAGQTAPPWRRPAAVAVCCGAIGICAVAWVVWHTHDRSLRPYWVARLNLAADIARLVPADARVAAFWPGLLGEFSQHPVTPLDGIIGSQSYFGDYVKKGREMDYMRTHNIHYLAIYLTEDVARLLDGPAPLIQNWSDLGQLRLWQARQAVKRVLSVRRSGQDGEGSYLLDLSLRPG